MARYTEQTIKNHKQTAGQNVSGVTIYAPYASERFNHVANNLGVRNKLNLFENHIPLIGAHKENNYTSSIKRVKNSGREALFLRLFTKPKDGDAHEALSSAEQRLGKSVGPENLDTQFVANAILIYKELEKQAIEAGEASPQVFLCADNGINSEKDIQKIAEMIEADTNRSVTLWGNGGFYNYLTTPRQKTEALHL